MPVSFENPEVSAKYDACREADGKVHIPAGKKKFPGDVPVGYAGPLSKITLAAADKAFASGSNILKLKEQPGTNTQKTTVPGPSKNGLNTGT